jgi:hypothetical protein
MATRMLNPGLLVGRYCTLCDYWYPKGYFKEHKADTLHQQCLADSKKMQAWYKANGS